MRRHTRWPGRFPSDRVHVQARSVRTGGRLYMNVDNLLGFLVIDTAARKVVGKAEIKADSGRERPCRSRSHGLAVANDGREVWSNDVVHNLTFVFDVTVATAETDRPLCRSAGSRTGLFRRRTQRRSTSRARAATRLSWFDVAAKKEKGANSVPCAIASDADARRGRTARAADMTSSGR